MLEYCIFCDGRKTSLVKTHKSTSRITPQKFFIHNQIVQKRIVFFIYRKRVKATFHFCCNLFFFCQFFLFFFLDVKNANSFVGLRVSLCERKKTGNRKNQIKSKNLIENKQHNIFQIVEQKQKKKTNVWFPCGTDKPNITADFSNMTRSQPFSMVTHIFKTSSPLNKQVYLWDSSL